MASTPNILVNVEIAHSDLFRVGMYLAKWRLLAGLLIMGALAAGFIYFFLLIDAREVLIQTSPLFIGIPLLTTIGQIFRIHAESRKLVASLPESHRSVQYMFSSEADGYDLVFGESFGHVSWKDVRNAKETKQYFVLIHHPFHIRVFPKRVFMDESEVARFRDLLNSRLGKNVRLLN